MATKKPSARRPFRIGDGMVLVAATAVAFTLYRFGRPLIVGFTTFDGAWETWLFTWMHKIVPFPALWSFAVFVINWWDSRKRRRHIARHAGIVACYAATVAIAATSLIFSTFSVIHILEDSAAISKILSHPSQMHAPLPFDSAPMEEIVGASVLGAWTALAASRRWRTERSWIDRLGRLLGIFWIGELCTYVYAYSG